VSGPSSRSLTSKRLVGKDLGRDPPQVFFFGLCRVSPLLFGSGVRQEGQGVLGVIGQKPSSEYPNTFLGVEANRVQLLLYPIEKQLSHRCDL
jgi:hypothetical protein